MKLITVIFCVMISISVTGQKKEYILKEGVYEYDFNSWPKDFFQTRDSLKELYPDMELLTPDYEHNSRRLIVKYDSSKIKSYYLISDTQNGSSFIAGTTSSYNFYLKKKKPGIYQGRNKKINLKVSAINEDTIEVNVRKGRIRHFYSGGVYKSVFEKMSAETMKLAYVRELNEYDEESLIMCAGDLKDRIEEVTKHRFMELFNKYGQDSIYAFAVLVRHKWSETDMYAAVNTLKYIDGLIDETEDLHYKYNATEWRYEQYKEDSLFKEISRICDDELSKRRHDKKAISLFQKELSQTCVDVLEKLKSERFFEQITGDDIFLIHNIVNTGFKKRKLKRIANRLNDNKYKKEYMRWIKIWKDDED